MDLRRLRAGEWITGLGGVALLGSLFMAWYDTPAGTRTAWESFAVVDLLLAAVALFAISLVPVTATQRVPAVPLAQDALVAIAGKLALLLILIRILWKPDGATGVEAGAWIGLIDVLVVIAGGWIAMRDERLPDSGRVADLTGRPTPESPPIETIPAP
jgi:carbon starvation protein CstA